MDTIERDKRNLRRTPRLVSVSSGSVSPSTANGSSSNGSSGSASGNGASGNGASGNGASSNGEASNGSSESSGIGSPGNGSPGNGSPLNVPGEKSSSGKKSSGKKLSGKKSSDKKSSRKKSSSVNRKRPPEELIAEAQGIAASSSGSRKKTRSSDTRLGDVAQRAFEAMDTTSDDEEKESVSVKSPVKRTRMNWNRIDLKFIKPAIKITPSPYPKNFKSRFHLEMQFKIGMEKKKTKTNKKNKKSADHSQELCVTLLDQSMSLCVRKFLVDGVETPFDLMENEYKKLVECGIVESPKSNQRETFLHTLREQKIKIYYRCPVVNRMTGKKCGCPILFSHQFYSTLFLDGNQARITKIPTPEEIWEHEIMNAKMDCNVKNTHVKCLKKHFLSCEAKDEHFASGGDWIILRNQYDESQKHYNKCKEEYFLEQCKAVVKVDFPTRPLSEQDDKDYGIIFKKAFVRQDQKDWYDFIIKCKMEYMSGQMSKPNENAFLNVAKHFKIMVVVEATCGICFEKIEMLDWTRTRGAVKGLTKIPCTCSAIYCVGCIRKCFRVQRFENTDFIPVKEACPGCNREYDFIPRQKFEEEIKVFREVMQDRVALWQPVIDDIMTSRRKCLVMIEAFKSADVDEVCELEEEYLKETSEVGDKIQEMLPREHNYEKCFLNYFSEIMINVEGRQLTEEQLSDLGEIFQSKQKLDYLCYNFRTAIEYGNWQNGLGGDETSRRSRSESNRERSDGRSRARSGGRSRARSGGRSRASSGGRSRTSSGGRSRARSGGRSRERTGITNGNASTNGNSTTVDLTNDE